MKQVNNKKQKLNIFGAIALSIALAIPITCLIINIGGEFLEYLENKNTKEIEKESKTVEKLRKQEAIDYFCKKYNTSKSKVQIIYYNYHHHNSKSFCIGHCDDEGWMVIKYNNKEYYFDYEEDFGWEETDEFNYHDDIDE